MLELRYFILCTVKPTYVDYLLFHLNYHPNSFLEGLRKTEPDPKLKLTMQ
jgi:hypothetical protein